MSFSQRNGINYDQHNCNTEKIVMSSIGIDYKKYMIRKNQFIILLKQNNKLEEVQESIVQSIAKNGSKQNDAECIKALSYIFGKDVELPTLKE